MAGTILILLSGAGIALSLLRSSEGALRCARAMLDLMIYVKNAVDNYSMPASEILRGCNGDILLDIGYPEGEEIPKSFLELHDGCDIPDPVIKDIFFDFAKDFGKSYRRQQSEECGMCIEKLRKRVSELEAQLPVRRKMIISICISVSLILVILLL